MPAFAESTAFPKLPPRSWAEISVGALQHNVRVLKACLPKGCAWMPAVKADAYGHGVGLVAPLLEKWGASKLGVANAEEGLGLRRLGCRAPVLVLSACLPGEREAVVLAGFEPVLSSAEEVKAWGIVARRCRKEVKAHLKLDTGMGRLGMWHEEARSLLEAARHCSGLAVAGCCTHFATADENRVFAKEQWRRFSAWIPLVREMFPGAVIHAANSAAILGLPETLADAVRPGIAVYGSAPLPAWRDRLRPVLTWKARVTCVRRLRRGQTVSYGAEFRAPRAMEVATLAVGYADGYRRAMHGKGSVMLGGRRCPVLGRVTMDQIMVDVTRAGTVRAGDAAILLGPGMAVEQWGRDLGTISYEIFTSIGHRVPRISAA